MKSQTIFTDPLINNNPITKQVLGVCSALAVTVLLDKAIVMTIALTLVLTFRIPPHSGDTVKLGGAPCRKGYHQKTAL